VNSHAFILLSFSQKIRKSEERNKDVKFSSKEQNDLIASICYMTPGTAKICQLLQATQSGSIVTQI
jgi:hypothetical protein